ncbi:hypothetical protein PVT01_000043900 [Plasmodium vivax]|uniref:VIR protein n=1 Tax=Plasmodium vivax TaxID=5855 RepID=A0A1G4E9M4_PLAVI|nr:hypothetical protein PVT01_000043900 [Plasmodium vivax]
MSKGTDNSLDKIEEEYSFIANSAFYKIYKEFDKLCNNYIGDLGESCPPATLGDSGTPPKVTDLLKKLYSNYYRVKEAYGGHNNSYFSDNLDEAKKIGCICLKYWLYDQTITKELEDDQINALFQGWQNHIESKISFTKLKPCKFYNLKKDEINNIKKVYALYTIFYGNKNNFGSCNSDTCRYMDYFGEGLDEFIKSINRCSSNLNRTDYCNEFKEFLDLCKEVNKDAGISIYDENTKTEDVTAGKYLLTVQTYENAPLYIYLKNEKLLNFVKTSEFLSNKSTTIAATSVVGSAIGLSSIFYYFYKFTPFGSTLRKGKGKNIVNIDEEAHNSLLYTSDTEQIPFQNREYKVAYHTI